MSFLEEDLGFGDITSDLLIPRGLKAKGVIVAKERGIVAGVEEAEMLFKHFGVNVKINRRDGNVVNPGDVIIEVEGEARSILMVERTVLNIMMRMSGIATETKALVEKIRKAGLNVKIAATRKTAPGLRALDKKAVIIGGGEPHRLRLDDAILIKDNHIALVGSVKEALQRARENVSFVKKIEVEAKTLSEALEASESGADIVMLDDMKPEQIREVVQYLKNKGLYGKVLLEASGGINPSNVIEYASTGVHVISLGYLTHSAKALDMSLEITT
ncbi:carboxylating nicotinate-nucleotide diphosphorylase [Candidatus Bathyarchaeota archaeon]|nr:carboxylating nicotinate-nucleotide diphosphorylase [Candidatus Bathyarchaeota archaeon]MBS7618442.1 carboxylating nicotinate-nucleotide diphosphorylase [Candidatus Bathyarchaeota archaeon]